MSATWCATLIINVHLLVFRGTSVIKIYLPSGLTDYGVWGQNGPGVGHNGPLVVPFLERQFKILINKKANAIHNSRLKTIASSTCEKIYIFR